MAEKKETKKKEEEPKKVSDEYEGLNQSQIDHIKRMKKAEE